MLEGKGGHIASIPPQWIFLKVLVNTQFKGLAYPDLWTTLLTKKPDKYDLEDGLHLLEIVLVLHISAAQLGKGIISPK